MSYHCPKLAPSLTTESLDTDYLYCHPAGVHCMLSKRLKTCRAKSSKKKLHCSKETQCT